MQRGESPPLLGLRRATSLKWSGWQAVLAAKKLGVHCSQVPHIKSAGCINCMETFLPSLTKKLVETKE